MRCSPMKYVVTLSAIFFIVYWLFPCVSLGQATYVKAVPEPVIGVEYQDHALKIPDNFDGYLRLRLLYFVLNFEKSSGVWKRIKDFVTSRNYAIFGLTNITAGNRGYASNFELIYDKEPTPSNYVNMPLTPWMKYHPNLQDTIVHFEMDAIPKKDSILSNVLRVIQPAMNAIPVLSPYSAGLDIASKVSEEIRKSLGDTEKKFLDFTLGLDKKYLTSRILYLWDNDDNLLPGNRLLEELKNGKLRMPPDGKLTNGNGSSIYQSSFYITLGIDIKDHLYNTDLVEPKLFPVAVQPFFERIHFKMTVPVIIREGLLLQQVVENLSGLSRIDRLVILDKFLKMGGSYNYRSAVRNGKVLSEKNVKLLFNKGAGGFKVTKADEILDIQDFFSKWGAKNYKARDKYIGDNSILIDVKRKSGDVESYDLERSEKVAADEIFYKNYRKLRVESRDEEEAVVSIGFLRLKKGSGDIRTKGKIYLAFDGINWQIKWFDLEAL